MSEPDVVPALVALGFSLNESRAYAALLQESPATGYEVGVRAQSSEDVFGDCVGGGDRYRRTKGSLHFTPDSPLPEDLVERLVQERLADVESGGQ